MVPGHTNLRHWVELVEAEFREMPGMHLTKRQVQRYWGLDMTTCELLLDTLEQGKVLRRTPKDAYVKAGLGF